MPVLQDFQTKTIELPEIKGDEILLEAMYFSVDPDMRGRMNDAKSYAPPFEIGKPITDGLVSKVLKSNSPEFKVDEMVTGNLTFRYNL